MIFFLLTNLPHAFHLKDFMPFIQFDVENVVTDVNTQRQ